MAPNAGEVPFAPAGPASLPWLSANPAQSGTCPWAGLSLSLSCRLDTGCRRGISPDILLHPRDKASAIWG